MILKASCLARLGSLCPAVIYVFGATVGHAQAPCVNPNMHTIAGSTAHWPPNTDAKIYIDPTFTPNEQADIKAAGDAWQASGAFKSVTYSNVDPGPFVSSTIRIRQGPLPVYLAGTVPNAYPDANGQPTSTISGADITFDRNTPLNTGGGSLHSDSQ